MGVAFFKVIFECGEGPKPMFLYTSVGFISAVLNPTAEYNSTLSEQHLTTPLDFFIALYLASLLLSWRVKESDSRR
jgi:hypothetical protein